MLSAPGVIHTAGESGKHSKPCDEDLGEELGSDPIFSSFYMKLDAK